MKKGKLIVFDGNDGSGKQTQAKLQIEKLKALGIETETLDFPRYYHNFFGKFLGECMTNQHGDWASTDPCLASMVYANDRLESSPMIQKWLDEGKFVLLDRFVSANQIHQGGKISDPEKREEFLKWLDTLEHDIFKIPRPDLVIYLDVPVEISLENLKKTGKKLYTGDREDAVEGNREYLENSRAAGHELVFKNQNWRMIDCMEDGQMLSKEVISEKIDHLLIEEGLLVIA
ncbi:MAG: hypothetical protein WC795_03250 [Candidatus Paceibacterota bacterium]|jgi:dTMP kinase